MRRLRERGLREREVRAIRLLQVQGRRKPLQLQGPRERLLEFEDIGCSKFEQSGCFKFKYDETCSNYKDFGNGCYEFKDVGRGTREDMARDTWDVRRRTWYEGRDTWDVVRGT